MYVCMYVCMHACMHIYSIYRVSQEECARLREGVPYVKVYRYDPKHLCPKLNGYGDNGQRKIFKKTINRNSMMVSVAYLIRKKHFLFNNNYFLTKFRALLINHPVFSNKSGSIFYFNCGVFLINYR